MGSQVERNSNSTSKMKAVSTTGNDFYTTQKSTYKASLFPVLDTEPIADELVLEKPESEATTLTSVISSSGQFFEFVQSATSKSLDEENLRSSQLDSIVEEPKKKFDPIILLFALLALLVLCLFIFVMVLFLRKKKQKSYRVNQEMQQDQRSSRF